MSRCPGVQAAAQGGARTLMAGVAPRIAKRTLQTALLWTLYEELVPHMSEAGRALQQWAAGKTEPERNQRS